MKVIHIFWCFLLFLTNLAAQQPAPIITYKKGVIEKNLVLHKTDNKFYYRYENATFRENYDATSLISYLFERNNLHSGLFLIIKKNFMLKKSYKSTFWLHHYVIVWKKP
jgi:hypothetical protein